jgi:hypothetical protein
MAAYGFPTGTTLEQVVSTFSETVGGDAATELSAPEGLEAEANSLGVSDRGALIAALEQDVSDGVFDGKANGQPLPLGSATLPATVGTNLFVSGVKAFADAEVAAIPELPPEAQDIVQVLPVAPVPVIPATITRIGPAAFSETLTANSPSVALAPFSTTSDVFEIEVVASS